MSWTSPRTWVTGETLTSTLLNTHVRDNMLAVLGTTGQFELVSNLITTDQVTASTTDVDLFTFPAVTLENIKYYIEIFIPTLRNSAANNYMVMTMREGATQIGEIMEAGTSSTGLQDVSATFRMSFVPAAGSHTYKIQWHTVFAGTMTLKASIADASFRIVRA